MGPRDALYGEPRHPYTQKLFAVLPRLDRRGERLDSLPGRVPGADAAFVGCRFADRCPAVFGRCRVEESAFHEAAPGHFVRCHLAEPKLFPPFKRGVRGDFYAGGHGGVAEIPPNPPL
jgi:peptide/nickel transport system ATP-binding protein